MRRPTTYQASGPTPAGGRPRLPRPRRPRRPSLRWAAAACVFFFAAQGAATTFHHWRAARALDTSAAREARAGLCTPASRDRFAPPPPGKAHADCVLCQRLKRVPWHAVLGGPLGATAAASRLRPPAEPEKAPHSLLLATCSAARAPPA